MSRRWSNVFPLAKDGRTSECGNYVGGHILWRGQLEDGGELRGGEITLLISSIFFGYSLGTFLSICNLKWAKIRHMPTPACKIHLSETPFFACKGLGLDPLCLWLLASWRAPLVTLLHPVYRTLLWVAKMFSRTLFILVLGGDIAKNIQTKLNKFQSSTCLSPSWYKKNLKGSK